MRVSMYQPTRLYGFAEGEDGKVFFHLECFHPGPSNDGVDPPPPIVGEHVIVEWDPASGNEMKAPRAYRVERLDIPIALNGVVETFNEHKGWGFAKGTDGLSYHLHRSEVLEGRLPIPGRKLAFWKGWRKGRPRACYVQILD